MENPNTGDADAAIDEAIRFLENMPCGNVPEWLWRLEPEAKRIASNLRAAKIELARRASTTTT